mgnify:CR=1 FL=1
MMAQCQIAAQQLRFLVCATNQLWYTSKQGTAGLLLLENRVILGKAEHKHPPLLLAAVGASFDSLCFSFVTLLEYAEESLKVNHVIVALTKTRPDRADLIRLFMFFGFVPVPPSHPMLPSTADDGLIHLAYKAD